MHIIIAIITAIGGVIWALYRLQNSGVDLNSFNPFYWARRRSWAKQVGTKPLHRIENPMESAAVLVVAMAELPGSVTRELKAEVLQLFCDEFEISRNNAAEMYAASSYLLRDATNIVAEVKNILAPTRTKYEDRHKKILISMLTQISESEGGPGKDQQELLQAVERELQSEERQSSKW